MAPQKQKIKSFISDSISVSFKSSLFFSKKPCCPSAFTWGDKAFIISECLAEWKNFSRHGNRAKNMQPQHAQHASKVGSWGVGRYFFDVRTVNGRKFRLYYDRSPKNAFDRSGTWILLAELKSDQD